MPRRRPVRVAIVGAGLMGRWHARAARHAGANVALVIDADAARASRLAGEHGARQSTNVDPASLFSGNVSDVDAVHICTPLETHGALARAAIERGVHVLSEKPFMATAAETAEILSHAESRGVIVCPVHQFLFQSGVRRVLGARQMIGPILHVDAIACSAGATGGRDDERDRVAADVLPHPLSLAAAVLDFRVAELAWTVQRPSPGELRATTVAGSATIALLVSMSGRPTTNMLRVIGAHGTAHADLFHGFAVVEHGRVSRAHKIAHPFALAGGVLGAASTNLARRVLSREPAYPGLRTLVAAFYAAVRGDAPPPISPAETLDVAKARDALVVA